MKLKQTKRALVAFLSLVVLASCQSVPQVDKGEGETEEADLEQDTGQRLSKSYYSALITDGQYAMSPSRGVVSGQSSEANLRQFEKGLYELAQEQFSTDDYLIQEGQLIDQKLAANWLAPKGKDFPEGLNPKEATAKTQANFKPKILNSLLEYDFLTQDEGGKNHLAGVTIGLALNSSDQFTNGEEEETVEIDQDTALAEGKKMAQEIVRRLRKKHEAYKKIPIQVALFYSAPVSDLAGGSFKAEAVSVAGSSFSDWQSINVQHKTLGLGDDTTAEDNVGFQRFREEVDSFFPQLSGIQGVGTYQNDQLVALDIQINSQFDGYSEVIALVQHASKQANTIFRNNHGEVTMRLVGPGGTSAIMKRPAGETNFTYQILN